MPKMQKIQKKRSIEETIEIEEPRHLVHLLVRLLFNCQLKGRLAIQHRMASLVGGNVEIAFFFYFLFSVSN